MLELIRSQIHRNIFAVSDPRSGDVIIGAVLAQGGSAMRRILGVLLIVLGVLANNFVYLQDLMFGQLAMTLDSWRAYGGIAVSILVILAGCWLLASRRESN